MPLAVAVTHLSLDEEPLNGLVTLQELPLSNQYPVAVVVSAWLNGVPSWFAVKAGGEGEPPPMME